MTILDKHIKGIKWRLHESGFGNQAIITGSKRVELIDFISQELTSLSKDMEKEIEKVLKNHFNYDKEFILRVAIPPRYIEPIETFKDILELFRREK